MAIVTKSVRIDEELWRKARGKALAEGMNLQELLTKLLTQYLKKRGDR